MRSNFKTGAIWEDKAAYSRAVLKNNTIEVAGTTAVRDGKIVHSDDAYLQALVIFDIIKHALEHFGSGLKDVVRTRLYVRNIEDWEKVTQAHKEVFNGINPVTTLLGGMMFVTEEMLVEIEATAILDTEEL